MKTSGMGLNLCPLEDLPIQPQLANDVSQCADLEVFATPIRHWSDLSGGRVVPLAVRAATSSE